MRYHNFQIKDYTRLINLPSSSKEGNNAIQGNEKLKPFYVVKDVTKYIYDRISPYIKKERKVTMDKVALILFLIELYRLKNGIGKYDEFFQEWCKRPMKKNFVEDEDTILKFVKELARTNCISLDKKIIERVLDLELDYMLSVGIIDINKSSV